MTFLRLVASRIYDEVRILSFRPCADCWRSDDKLPLSFIVAQGLYAARIVFWPQTHVWHQSDYFSFYSCRVFLQRGPLPGARAEPRLLAAKDQPFLVVDASHRLCRCPTRWRKLNIAFAKNPLQLVLAGTTQKGWSTLDASPHLPSSCSVCLYPEP